MDLSRYMRAQEAADVLHVERIHDAYLAGEMESDEIPGSVWGQIAEHNKLARRRRRRG